MLIVDVQVMLGIVLGSMSLRVSLASGPGPGSPGRVLTFLNILTPQSPGHTDLCFCVIGLIAREYVLDCGLAGAKIKVGETFCAFVLRIKEKI